MASNKEDRLACGAADPLKIASVLSEGDLARDELRTVQDLYDRAAAARDHNRARGDGVGQIRFVGEDGRVYAASFELVVDELTEPHDLAVAHAQAVSRRARMPLDGSGRLPEGDEEYRQEEADALGRLVRTLPDRIRRARRRARADPAG